MPWASQESIIQATSYSEGSFTMIVVGSLKGTILPDVTDETTKGGRQEVPQFPSRRQRGLASVVGTAACTPICR